MKTIDRIALTLANWILSLLSRIAGQPMDLDRN